VQKVKIMYCWKTIWYTP